MFLDNVTPTPPSSEDKLAEGISLALHLLQSYAHRQNFLRRTKPPGPLSSYKRANAPYALLRSLITRANHQSTLSRTYTLFNSICSILTAVSHSPSAAYTITEPPLELRSNLSPTEATVVALFEHLHAQVTLNLTPSCTLNMRIRTSLYPLTMSNYNLTLEPTDCTLQESCRAPGIVDQWHKANDYILFAVSCALAISLTSPDTKSDTNGTEAKATPELRWERTTRPHIIRLIAAHQENQQQQLKNKQASFFLLPTTSSLGTKTSPPGLRLRVGWECFDNSSIQHPPGPDAAPERKGGKGEGFYEWIILDGQSQVVGRGASSGGNVWGPGTSVKSLKEVMEIAGST